MAHSPRIASALTLVLALVTLEGASSPPWRSTRVANSLSHARQGTRSYPFRAVADEILRELDLRAGDVVVDVGAGDGWWAARMAPCVGETGVIHAADIKPKLVEKMKRKYGHLPQLRPYRCPEDGTGLPSDSCDIAFFAQVYHHLEAESQVAYLRHLADVLKPTGRIVIIEKHAGIATRYKTHTTAPHELFREAEAAGWVLARYELLPRTYHYLAILVQRSLFPPEPIRL